MIASLLLFPFSPFYLLPALIFLVCISGLTFALASLVSEIWIRKVEEASRATEKPQGEGNEGETEIELRFSPQPTTFSLFFFFSCFSHPVAPPCLPLPSYPSRLSSFSRTFETSAYEAPHARRPPSSLLANSASLLPSSLTNARPILSRKRTLNSSLSSRSRCHP